MAANRRRGEIAATIDGRDCTLCLTLGALAELEDAFAVDDLSALAQRFSSGRLSARDLIRILGAGLRGAGTAMSDEEVALIKVDGGIAGIARIVAELLKVTFGASEAAGDPPMP